MELKPVGDRRGVECGKRAVPRATKNEPRGLSAPGKGTVWDLARRLTLKLAEEWGRQSREPFAKREKSIVRGAGRGKELSFRVRWIYCDCRSGRNDVTGGEQKSWH